MKVLGERNTENLAHFIRKARQFKIPDFQRAYAWGDAQVKNFLASIDTVIKGPKSHYFGSIVYFPESDYYSIIDGQQRLTTTILFLTAVLHILVKHPEKSDVYTAEQIEKDFLYDVNDDENRIILRAATTDRDAFERILRNKPAPTDEFRPLYRNYKKFYEYLLEKENLDQYIEAFNKFDIITIALDSNDDNPQIIFENINSTGEPLTAGDKIRNYALMLNNEESRDYVYNTYWLKIEKQLIVLTKQKQEDFISDFFRNLMISETSKWFTDADTYDTFKEYYNKRVPNHTQDELDNFYKKTQSQLENYLFIKLLKGEDDKFSFIREPNFRLFYLQTDLRIAFLMTILEKYKNGEITQEDTETVFDYLERYFGRQVFFGRIGAGSNKVIATWPNIIAEKVANSDSETTFGQEFIKYISSISGTNYGVPSDNDIDYAITKQRYKNIHLNYILATICDKNYKKNKEMYPPNILRGIYNKTLPLSIEHIMPQTLTTEWRKELGDDWEQIYDQYINKLANLTLTGYNSKYSNRPFSEKLTIEEVGFKDSPLYINKFVADCDKWNLESLQGREEWLQDIVKTTWAWPSKYHINDHGTLLTNNTRSIRTNGKVLDIINNDIEENDIIGTKPQKLLINDVEYDTNSWKDLTQIVLTNLAQLQPQQFKNAVNDNQLSYNGTPKKDGGVLRYPELIKNTDIYFESNNSAISLIKMIISANAIADTNADIKVELA